MSYYYYLRFIPFIILVSFFVIPVSPSQTQASPRIIDNVEIKTLADGQDILIRFNYPMRYISHNPASGGQVMRVQMKPISAFDMEANQGHREELNWEGAQKILLLGVCRT